MPLKNDVLFNIKKLAHDDGSINATLDINKDSNIFNGHFPGHPVVPGACMLQIVKEVMEAALNTSLRLKKADHLKFMAMIDPGVTQTVELEIAHKFVEDDINVTAKLINGDVVYFKLQGSFVKG
jgi:3-hydroxyacyl-[acyl-carrier-protein] dehydratase